MMLLVNPISGTKAIGSQMIPIMDKFTKAGYEITTHISQSSEDVIDVFKNHSNEYDLMVCCGGDGTLNLAVDSLIRSGNHPEFAYIPAGTVNDFATTHRIPKKANKAADAIIQGAPNPCDIGLFEDRSFVYVAAFGTIAAVSYATPQKLKNFLGKAAYILNGTVQFFRMKSYKATVRIDGKEITDRFLAGIFSSSISVGGFKLPILSGANVSDGKMEILLVRKPHNPIQAFSLVFGLFKKKLKKSYLIYEQADKVEILGDCPIPFTVDGEYAGSPENASIEMRQAAIQMIT